MKKKDKMPLEKRLRKIKKLVGGTTVFKLGIRKNKNKIDLLSAERHFFDEDKDEERERELEEEKLIEECEYIG